MTHPPYTTPSTSEETTILGEGKREMAELWAVSIAGPDDLIAVVSYDDACRVANSFNEWWRQHIASRGGLHKFDPHMWATPVLYPWTPEQHAEWVANPSKDYAAFVADVPPHPTLSDEAKARRPTALDELGALDGELL